MNYVNYIKDFCAQKITLQMFRYNNQSYWQEQNHNPQLFFTTVIIIITGPV